MKKIIIFVFIMCLSLSACAPISPAASSKESGDSSSLSVSSEPSAEGTDVESSSEEGSYFRDNVLKVDDLTIQITDYKVISPGEEGNESGDKPVIAFWYTITNTSDENLSALSVWSFHITAIQDNDPNIVNELEVGILPDKQFRETQLSDIKPGGSLENAIAYVLDDSETPVTLKAKEGLLGDELGEIEFQIQ